MIKMPRTLSWTKEIVQMIIMNRSQIKLVFKNGTSALISTEGNDTLEFIYYDSEGNYITSEPVDVGWAGHA